MNNFIGNNINAIRVHFGLSQEQLAEATGISQTTISAWECGDSIPRKNNVMKIVNAIDGIQFDDIMSEEHGFAKRALKQSATPFEPVPLIGRISAGEPITMESFDDAREAPYTFKADDPDVFLLRVDGDSVNRVIPDGFFALISPKYREPNEHDLFAVCVNGYDATIKHVKKLANGFMLIPDSHDPTYRPRIFDYNDETTETVTIIGKVVWACMPY